MKVLVTGANGQVGTELIQRGQKLGLEMTGLDQSELNIASREQVNNAIATDAPDIVINAAAYTLVDKAETEMELAYAVNRDGPAYLAEACAASNIPMLHISTDYVFDGEQESAYLETDNPNPNTIYGKSKLEGDNAVSNALPEHIILRVAWVFSASGNNFVRTMLRLGSERGELSVVNDQHGCPTWARDIANTLLTMAQQYRDKATLPWGTYHYNSTPVANWYGFAETIFEQALKLGLIENTPLLHTINTAQYPTPAQRPANSALNCNKINQQFGIEVPDWRMGLSNVLSEWKAQ
jgi:dTDP-4-dehydrorhamnose reductase